MFPCIFLHSTFRSFSLFIHCLLCFLFLHLTVIVLQISLVLFPLSLSFFRYVHPQATRCLVLCVEIVSLAWKSRIPCAAVPNDRNHRCCSATRTPVHRGKFSDVLPLATLAAILTPSHCLYVYLFACLPFTMFTFVCSHCFQWVVKRKSSC